MEVQFKGWPYERGSLIKGWPYERGSLIKGGLTREVVTLRVALRER